MRKKITLTDVSREAGVGVATVSRALGDHPDVSATTREKVREIARQMGYRPSIAARALRSGEFHAISAIIPDAGWGWWEPVVHAAFEAASAAGYQLMVHPVAGAEGGVSSVIDGLTNVPTEGVIIISVPDQDGAREACDQISLPAVAIDDTSREIRFPTISSRNRAGARDVVAHLVSQGRRSVGLLRGTPGPQWGEGQFLEERAAGYRDALEDAGIAVDDRWVVDVADPFDESAATWPELDAALADGLEIDALFCVADLMAAPALRSLRAAGRAVPHDVAVVGFDDERAALLLDPQLTTVRQPYEAMGRLAVELLLEAIDGVAPPHVRHELDTSLVVRRSSASD